MLMHFIITKISSKILYAIGYGIYMGIGSAFIYHNILERKTMILPHIYIKPMK